MNYDNYVEKMMKHWESEEDFKKVYETNVPKFTSHFFLSKTFQRKTYGEITKQEIAVSGHIDADKYKALVDSYKTPYDDDDCILYDLRECHHVVESNKYSTKNKLYKNPKKSIELENSDKSSNSKEYDKDEYFWSRTHVMIHLKMGTIEVVYPRDCYIYSEEIVSSEINWTLNNENYDLLPCTWMFNQSFTWFDKKNENLSHCSYLWSAVYYFPSVINSIYNHIMSCIPCIPLKMIDPAQKPTGWEKYGADDILNSRLLTVEKLYELSLIKDNGYHISFSQSIDLYQHFKLVLGEDVWYNFLFKFLKITRQEMENITYNISYMGTHSFSAPIHEDNIFNDFHQPPSMYYTFAILAQLWEKEIVSSYLVEISIISSLQQIIVNYLVCPPSYSYALNKIHNQIQTKLIGRYKSNFQETPLRNLLGNQGSLTLLY